MLQVIAEALFIGCFAVIFVLAMVRVMEWAESKRADPPPPPDPPKQKDPIGFRPPKD